MAFLEDSPGPEVVIQVPGQFMGALNTKVMKQLAISLGALEAEWDRVSCDRKRRAQQASGGCVVACGRLECRFTRYVAIAFPPGPGAFETRRSRLITFNMPFSVVSSVHGVYK